MSKDGKYTHIMDTLQLIHEENVYIIKLLAAGNGIDRATVESFGKMWDDKFNEIRKHW